MVAVNKTQARGVPEKLLFDIRGLASYSFIAVYMDKHNLK
jgi:hypothetical protein